LRQCQGSRSLSREQPAPALPLRFVRKLSSSTQLSRMLDGISKAESSNLAARIHTRESNAATRPRSAADVVAVEFPARPSFSPNGSSFVQYPAKWNIPFPRERPRCLRRHAAPPHSPFRPPPPWNNRDRFPHAVLHHLRRQLSASTRRIEDDTSIYRYVPTLVLAGRRWSLILFPRIPPRTSPTHPGEFKWNYKRSSRLPRRVRIVFRDSIMELVGFSAEKFRYPPVGERSSPLCTDAR
jgi:hypothetical protein